MRSDLFKILLALVLIGMTATVSACGDDSSDSKGGDGDGDAAQDSGTGGTTEAAVVMCGGEKCEEVVNLQIIMLEPCCVEEGIDADGSTVAACGAGMGACEQLDQVGADDGQCADEMFSLMGFIDVDAVGCCKPDNTCGLSVALNPRFGCMSRDSSGLSMLGASFEAAECDYVEGATRPDESDAGADAGI